jgi:hypothetical protein
VADVYDRSGKWLLAHHGDSILRLAGMSGVVACRPAQAEVVQPKQLLDALLEATLAGRDRPVPAVVELATYPERRAVEQAVRDALLVYLDRREVPEVVIVVLRPKGRYRIPKSFRAQSALGWSGWSVRWRVVELWKVPAEQLLALGDVGALPWVPLAHIDGPPEPVLRECRRRIDEQAPADERANLLAVCQVLGRLRYNAATLTAVFGGRQSMIESPLMQELLADRDFIRASPVLQEFVEEGKLDGLRKAILRFLTERFGPVPADVGSALQTADAARLDDLLGWAARCASLDEFRARLAP